MPSLYTEECEQWDRNAYERALRYDLALPTPTVLPAGAGGAPRYPKRVLPQDLPAVPDEAPWPEVVPGEGDRDGEDYRDE